MNDILKSFNYFNDSINKTLPMKIRVVNLTPRAKKILVRRKMSLQEEQYYESVVGHYEPEEVNDLGGGGEPIPTNPF